MITNLHIANLNVLITLTTDTTLLLIMFFGLRRRGFHDREAFGLGRFMWKQVGYWCFSLAVVFSAHIAVRIHEGVIWLLVATIADVLPAVSGQTDVLLLSAHHDVISQVFLCLNINGRFTFISIKVLSSKNR